MKLITHLIKPIAKSTLALAFTATLLTGCGSDADIVKDGTMPEYPQAPVGKVLESYFNDPEWKSIEMGGKTYVTFSGKINQLLFVKAIERNRPKLQNYVLHLLNTKNENDPIYKAFTSKNEEIYQSTIGDLEDKVKENRIFLKNTEHLINKEFRELHIKEKATLDKIEALKKSINEIWKKVGNAAYKAYDNDKTERWRGFLDISDAEFDKKHKAVIEAKKKAKTIEEQVKTLENTISEKKDDIRRDFIRRKRAAWTVLNDYKTKLKKQAQAKYQEEYEKLMASLTDRFEKDYYWVPQSETTFKWLLHANKKDFELIEASNDYWALYGESTKNIFDTIYAD